MMNLLTPNDFLHSSSNQRRKSVCNGAILLSSSPTSTSGDGGSSQSSNSHGKKKERNRRGSLCEPPVRRPSLVHRWLKHLTDATELYRPKRNNNHENVDENSQSANTTKDSFESTSSDPHLHLLPATSSSASLTAVGQPADAQSIQSGGSGNNDSIYHNIVGGQPSDDTKEEDGDGDGDEKTRDNLKSSSDGGDDSDQYERNVGKTNSNDTRTLTEVCRLVAPSEVMVNVSPAFRAEPVVTPSERLRRLDELIRSTLAEKQKIVCDMFRVPVEHFSAIADIAGQPEASEEPSDIVLSAFAQVQSLTETLNDFIKVTTHQQISAVSTSLCDDCYRTQKDNLHKVCSNTAKDNEAIESLSPSPAATNIQNIIEDDNGYCEISDVWPKAETTSGLSSENVIDKRQSTISVDSIAEETEHELKAATSEIQGEETSTAIPSENKDEVIPNSNIPNESSHFEINDAYDSTSLLSEPNQDDESTTQLSSLETQRLNDKGKELCGTNRLAHVESLVPSVPCHLIASYVTLLNEQITRLMPKLEERDIERENLKRENQQLRELLTTMQIKDRVSESEETSTSNEQSTNNSQAE